MFYVSKLLGSVIEPANFLALLSFLAVLLGVSPDQACKRIARKTLVFVALCLCLMAVLPVGKWALAPLENRYANIVLPEELTGIILLTGDENATVSEARRLPVAGYATQRYVHVARLARRYPDAKIIVVGDTRPSYPSGTVTTKMIAQSAMKAMGIPESQVLYEEESRNTYENAMLASQILKPKTGEKWALVTSGFHMPRAVLCFMKTGMDVIPSISDYYTDGKIEFALYTHLSQNLHYLTVAAHEYYGLLAYRLMKRIDRLWI
jgi:uncharacterized SAM-binding protein YcdF (DUF218 family)